MKQEHIIYSRETKVFMTIKELAMEGFLKDTLLVPLGKERGLKGYDFALRQCWVEKTRKMNPNKGPVV